MKGDSTPVLILLSCMIGMIFGVIFFLVMKLASLIVLGLTEDYLMYVMAQPAIVVASIATSGFAWFVAFLFFFRERRAIDRRK